MFIRIIQLKGLWICDIQFLKEFEPGVWLEKCDLHLGSALSMPTSAASTREGTTNSTTSKFLFKVNTLTFALKPLIVSRKKKEEHHYIVPSMSFYPDCIQNF